MLKRIALLALFTLLILGFGKNSIAQERKATITYFEGEVEVLRAEETKWTKAKIKMDLEAGDKLRTALASKCEITLEDGSTITIDENTTIDLKELLSEEETKKTKFKLWMGKVKVRAEKLRKGSSFQVETPTGLAGVRGTIWTIEYDNLTRITTVSVEEGEVYARGINQGEEEEVIVREGESADIYPEEGAAGLSIPGFTVRAELSPHPDFDWYNEPPELTFVVTAETVLPDTPLIITVNGVEKARLFGGPTYNHTITDLYFVDQGRNDLVTSCGFLGGEDVLTTIPVYFDDIAPIITDPLLDFSGRMLSVRIFGETGENASGVRRVEANGIQMFTVVQDEEYEVALTGIDLKSSILIGAWDKAGITGNKGTLPVDPKEFDFNPPVITVQRCEFAYNGEYQLKIEARVTDIESGVAEITVNGNPMTLSGDIYTATLSGPFYEGKSIKIEARDNVGNTSHKDISSDLTPPPPGWE